jgi:hypothetical protein
MNFNIWTAEISVAFNFFLYRLNNFFYFVENRGAKKIPKPPPPPPPPPLFGGQGLQIKSFLAGKRGKYRDKNEVAATEHVHVLLIYIHNECFNALYNQ